MPLRHADIWRAIDRLARKNSLTPSALARKANLSPTLFNPSKRENAGRKHWPSMESIAAILVATGVSFDAFAALASTDTAAGIKVPAMTLSQAAIAGAFDDKGRPTNTQGETVALPAFHDESVFALEVDHRGLEPFYPEGCLLILSPNEKARRGDHVGVSTVQGDVLIRKLNREGVQRVELAALTPNDPPITLARKDIHWMARIIWASQ
jgi:phage repressor protein C with HTH and peptisase S24 domain